MTTWVRQEENMSGNRQRKREAEEATKVGIAPGVTVESLKRSRSAALIGPTSVKESLSMDGSYTGRCSCAWS